MGTSVTRPCVLYDQSTRTKGSGSILATDQQGGCQNLLQLQRPQPPPSSDLASRRLRRHQCTTHPPRDGAVQAEVGQKPPKT